MAITKIDWPAASAPDVTVDYPRQNNNLQAGIRGDSSVSLTNWDDSTTAPAVILGSVIECNGVFYEVTTANETISTTGASTGTVYLIFDESAEEYVWSSSTPSWSTSKNAWYIGSDRFTGHLCEWDGASAYDAKREYGAGQNGDIFMKPLADGVLQSGSLSISFTASQSDTAYFPKGYIQIANGLLTTVIAGTGTATMTVSVKHAVTGGLSVILLETESNTVTNKTVPLGQTVYSNGSNYQIVLGGVSTGGTGTHTASLTYRYHEFAP